MSAPDILQSRLVLVGPGRAGTAFARSWTASGGRLAAILARRREQAERAARALGGTAATLERAPKETDLLVIAVSDDAIAPVASRLAPRIRCRFAFHLSGALPAETLAPLRRRGAAVASLHPLRPFSGDPREGWSGALVAIEGDRQAVQAGKAIAVALSARGRPIRAGAKPLYHAAATLAAGGTMALLALAVEAAVEAGLPEVEAREALARLSSEAAAAVAGRPFAEAFTGPIARRDVETVRAHRRASAGLPEFSLLYELLARETLRATAGRGKEERVRRLLRPSPAAAGGSSGSRRRSPRK